MNWDYFVGFLCGYFVCAIRPSVDMWWKHRKESKSSGSSE